jgi:hypothetical protein
MAAREGNKAVVFLAGIVVFAAAYVAGLAVTRLLLPNAEEASINVFVRGIQIGVAIGFIGATILSMVCWFCASLYRKQKLLVNSTV